VAGTDYDGISIGQGFAIWGFETIQQLRMLH
jgi:hypothetical protein